MANLLLDQNFSDFNESVAIANARHLTVFDITRRPHFASVYMSCEAMTKLQSQGVKVNVLLFDYSFIEKDSSEKLRKLRIDIYKEFFKNVSQLTNLDYSKVNFIDAVIYFKTSSEAVWGNFQKLSSSINIDILAFKNKSQNFKMASYIRELFYLSAIKEFDPDIYHSGGDEQWSRKLLATNPKEANKYVFSHPVLPKFSPKLENHQSGDFRISHKMSRDDENSAIHCNERRDGLAKKINNSYCLEGDLKNNAVLEWIKETVYEQGRVFDIVRPEKWGGNKTLRSFLELEDEYLRKSIHPFDLKNSYTEFFTDWTWEVRKNLRESHIFEDYSYVYESQ